MAHYSKGAEVEDSPATYDEAVDAFIEGKLVDWGDYAPPNNQQILFRIEQKQRIRVANQAIAHIKAFKPDLSEKEKQIVTALSDEMRTDSKLLEGMLRMLAVVYGYSQRQIYEDLAKKHNEFMRKHNDPKPSGR